MKPINEHNMELLRVSISKVLSPDLLRKDWRTKAEGEHITYGHCYVAAEALFHLVGGHSSEFKPRYVKYFDASDDMMCTHWWLYSIKRNLIYDPTKEQYLHCNLEPPYHNKKTSGFLTIFPSKRAVIVMNRVKEIVDASVIEDLVETFKIEVDEFFC
jgi:hypothetical protein